MKTTIFFLSLIAALFFNAANASNNPSSASKRGVKYDESSILHITGYINNNDDTEEDCFIELISPNKAIETIVLPAGEEKFEFVLARNTEYMIRITKKGYLNKTVSVKTHMVTLENELHHFKFETALIEKSEMDKMNKDLLDYPAAIIHYDYKSESFSHNVQYTDMIKKELYHLQESTEGSTQVEKPSRPLSSKPHSFLTSSR